MDPKSIFTSKTFWINIAMAVASFSGYFPSKYAVPVAAAANIAVRFLTDSPVTLTGS